MRRADDSGSPSPISYRSRRVFAAAVPWLYLAAYAAAFAIDVRERRIPNWITYPLLLIGLIARPADVGLAPFASIVAAAVAFALFAAFALRGWMGMGDAMNACWVLNRFASSGFGRDDGSGCVAYAGFASRFHSSEPSALQA